MKGIASAALKNLHRRDLIEDRAFVNGVWVERDQTFAIVDPAGGDHLADVASCTLNDVDFAIDAASNAFMRLARYAAC